MIRVRPGMLVGDRYRIGPELGRGGMGVVYRARHIGLGVDVALKVLPPGVADDPGAVARLAREARVASALRHPNVVRVHDFGQDGPVVWLAMTLLEGRTLADRIDTGRPLGGDFAALIGRQVSDALVAAHEISLVHRDIKPGNVFLEAAPAGAVRAVVVDFGLALRLDDSSGRVTTDGRLMGSPSYMSPEQARNEPPTPSSDIYSLGCVLFEMVAGRAPFPGAGIQVITRHLFAPVPPLAAHAPGVDSRYASLTRRMLSKSAHERPTASAVRGALDDIIARPEKGGPPAVHTRADRMVEGATQRLPSVESTTIGLVGTLPEPVALALSAHRINALPLDDELVPSVILAVGCPVERIEALVGRGVPVVGDTNASDIERMSTLLRIGAADVVRVPLDPAKVVRTLQRVIKRARRRR